MGGGTSKVDPYVLRVDGNNKYADNHDDKLETLRLFESKSKATHISMEKSNSSTGSLDRKKSSPQLISSSNKMKSTTDMISSIKNRSTASNKKTMTNVTVCSELYPWLLKSANLRGSSLSDFEFGRIIGTCCNEFIFELNDLCPLYARSWIDGDSSSCED